MNIENIENGENLGNFETVSKLSRFLTVSIIGNQILIFRVSGRTINLQYSEYQVGFSFFFSILLLKMT